MSRLTSRRRTLPHRALLWGQGKASIEVFGFQAFDVSEFQTLEVLNFFRLLRFLKFRGSKFLNFRVKVKVHTGCFQTDPSSTSPSEAGGHFLMFGNRFSSRKKQCRVGMGGKHMLGVFRILSTLISVQRLGFGFCLCPLCKSDLFCYRCPSEQLLVFLVHDVKHLRLGTK